MELGLFADENEGMYAMKEAVDELHTPRQMHILFVHLLINECLPIPIDAWADFRENLALDFTLQNRNIFAVGVNLVL